MSWVDIAVGAGGSATAVALVGSIATAQLRHAIRRVVSEEVTEELRTVKDEVTALHLKLTKETGGNSNGMRQKLNEVGRDLVSVGKDVAHLKGAFEQHTHSTS